MTEHDSDPPRPTTPHDGLFKFTFAQPEHARGLLRALLPADALALVDLDSLERVSGTFVDPELSELESDLLYRVNVAGREALVMVLIEHQSRSDPAMPFRLARYMMRALEEWSREHPTALKLPAIVPLVVAHAERAWSAPTSLLELYNVPDELRSALAPHLLNFRFLLDDLTSQSPEQLLQRQTTVFAKLVLFLLQRARTSSDLLDEMRSWLTLARAVSAIELADEEQVSIVAYTRVVAGIDPARMRSFLRDDLLNPNPDEVMSSAEKLIRMIGPPIWLEQGRNQGRSEGRAELLLRLLSRRFGPMSAEVETRLHHASSEELDAMGERVLDAKTLAEVLDPR